MLILLTPWHDGLSYNDLRSNDKIDSCGLHAVKLATIRNELNKS